MSKAKKIRKVKFKVKRKAAAIEARRLKRARVRALYANNPTDDDDIEKQYRFAFQPVRAFVNRKS